MAGVQHITYLNPPMFSKSGSGMARSLRKRAKKMGRQKKGPAPKSGAAVISQSAELSGSAHGSQLDAASRIVQSSNVGVSQADGSDLGTKFNYACTIVERSISGVVSFVSNKAESGAAHSVTDKSQIDDIKHEYNLDDFETKLREGTGRNVLLASKRLNWLADENATVIFYNALGNATSLTTGAFVNHGLDDDSSGNARSELVLSCFHGKETLLALAGELVLDPPLDEGVNFNINVHKDRIQYITVKRDVCEHIQNTLGEDTFNGQNILPTVNTGKERKKLRALNVEEIAFSPSLFGLGESVKTGLGTLDWYNIDYTWYSMSGDIILMKLSETYTLPDGGQPVLLSDSDRFPFQWGDDHFKEGNVQSQLELWAAGFGVVQPFYKQLQNNELSSGKLHAVQLHVAASRGDLGMMNYTELKDLRESHLKDQDAFEHSFLFMSDRRDALFLRENGLQQTEATGSGDSGGSAVGFMEVNGKKNTPVSFGVVSWGYNNFAEHAYPTVYARVSSHKPFLKAVSNMMFAGSDDQEIAFTSEKFLYSMYGMNEAGTTLNRLALPFHRGNISTVGDVIVSPKTVKNGKRNIRSGDIIAVTTLVGSSAGTSVSWDSVESRRRGFSAKVTLRLHKPDGTVFDITDSVESIVNSYANKAALAQTGFGGTLDSLLAGVKNGASEPVADDTVISWSDGEDVTPSYGAGPLKLDSDYILAPYTYTDSTGARKYFREISLTEWPMDVKYGGLVSDVARNGTNLPTTYLHAGVNGWYANPSDNESLCWYVARLMDSNKTFSSDSSGKNATTDVSMHIRVYFPSNPTTSDHFPQLEFTDGNDHWMTCVPSSTAVDAVERAAWEGKHEFVLYVGDKPGVEGTLRHVDDTDDQLIEMIPNSTTHNSETNRPITEVAVKNADGTSVEFVLIGVAGADVDNKSVFLGSTLGDPIDTSQPEVLSLNSTRKADAVSLRILTQGSWVFAPREEVVNDVFRSSYSKANYKASSADHGGWEIVGYTEGDGFVDVLTHKFSPHEDEMTKWSSDFFAFVVMHTADVSDKSQMELILFTWPKNYTGGNVDKMHYLYESKFAFAMNDDPLPPSNSTVVFWIGGENVSAQTVFDANRGTGLFPSDNFDDLTFHKLDMPMKWTTDSSGLLTSGPDPDLAEAEIQFISVHGDGVKANHKSKIPGWSLISAGGTDVRPVRFVGSDPEVHTNVIAKPPRTLSSMRLAFQAPEALQGSESFGVSLKLTPPDTGVIEKTREFTPYEFEVEFDRKDDSNQLFVPDTFQYWTDQINLDEVHTNGWPDSRPNGTPNLTNEFSDRSDIYIPSELVPGHKRSFVFDKVVPEGMAVSPAMFPGQARGPSSSSLEGKWSNEFSDESNIDAAGMMVYAPTYAFNYATRLGFSGGSKAIKFVQGSHESTIPATLAPKIFGVQFHEPKADPDRGLSRSLDMFPWYTPQAFWLAETVKAGRDVQFHELNGLRVVVVTRERNGNNETQFKVEYGPKLRVTVDTSAKQLNVEFEKLPHPAEFTHVPAGLASYSVVGRPLMDGQRDVAFLGRSPASTLNENEVLGSDALALFDLNGMDAENKNASLVQRLFSDDEQRMTSGGTPTSPEGRQDAEAHKNENACNPACTIEILSAGPDPDASVGDQFVPVSNLEMAKIAAQSLTVSSGVAKIDTPEDLQSKVVGNRKQFGNFIRMNSYTDSGTTSTVGLKDPKSADEGKDLDEIEALTLARSKLNGARSLLDTVTGSREDRIRSIIDVKGKDKNGGELAHTTATLEVNGVRTKGIKVYSVVDGADANSSSVTDVTDEDYTNIEYTVGGQALVTTRFSTAAVVEDPSPEQSFSPSMTQPYVWGDTTTVMTLEFLDTVEVTSETTTTEASSNTTGTNLASQSVAVDSQNSKKLKIRLRADSSATYDDSFAWTLVGGTITVGGTSLDDDLEYTFTHKVTRAISGSLQMSDSPRIGTATAWTLQLTHPVTSNVIQSFLQSSSEIESLLKSASTHTKVVDRTEHGGGIANATIDTSTGAGTLKAAENTATLTLKLLANKVFTSDGAHANEALALTAKTVVGAQPLGSNGDATGTSAVGARLSGPSLPKERGALRLDPPSVRDRNGGAGYNVYSVGKANAGESVEGSTTVIIRRKGTGGTVGYLSERFDVTSGSFFREITTLNRVDVERYGRLSDYDSVLEDVVVRQSLRDKASPLTGRLAPALCTCTNGRIVVAGGRIGDGRNDVYYSDDEGQTWIQARADGGSDGFTASWDGASVCLADGTVLYAGGTQDDSSSLSGVWSASQDNLASWTSIGSLPTPARGHALIVAPADGGNDAVSKNGDETVYVVGGRSGSTADNDANLFLSSVDSGASWTAEDAFPSSMGGGRFRPGTVISNSGLIYVFGGGPSKVILYDGTGWNEVVESMVGDAATPIRDTRAFTAPGNKKKMVVVSNGDQSGTTASSVQRISVSEDSGSTWRTLPMRGGHITHNSIREGFVAFMRADGSVAMGLGLDGSGHLDTWLYSDAPYDAWSPLTKFMSETVYETGIAPGNVGVLSNNGTDLTDVSSKSITVSLDSQGRINYADALQRMVLQVLPSGATYWDSPPKEDYASYLEVRSADGKGLWDSDGVDTRDVAASQDMEVFPGALAQNGSVLKLVTHPGAFMSKAGLSANPAQFTEAKSGGSIEFTYTDGDAAPVPSVSVVSNEMSQGGTKQVRVDFGTAVTALDASGVDVTEGSVDSVSRDNTQAFTVIVSAPSGSLGMVMTVSVRAGAVRTDNVASEPNVSSDTLSLSIGDPYITPVNGQRYKLPVDTRTYRLLQTRGGTMVNGTQRRIHQDQAFREYGYRGDCSVFEGAEPVSFFRWITLIHPHHSGKAMLVDAETLTAYRIPDIAHIAAAPMLQAARNGTAIPLNHPEAIVLPPASQRTPFRGIVVTRDRDIIPGSCEKYGILDDTVCQTLRITFRDKGLGRVDLRITRFSNLPLVRNSISMMVEHENRVTDTACGALVQQAPVRTLVVRRPADQRRISTSNGTVSAGCKARNPLTPAVRDQLQTLEGNFVGSISVPLIQ